MKTFGSYAIAVLTVLAVVLGIAWLYAPDERFIQVSLICYGFFLGYLSAWFHIGRRHGFGKLSKYLTDNPDDPAR
ncbi:MAG TPA: hypothetical protein VFK88_03525 [Gallionella sp.]|nr:hypothetical protein [Gallionella sp.]